MHDMMQVLVYFLHQVRTLGKFLPLNKVCAYTHLQVKVCKPTCQILHYYLQLYQASFQRVALLPRSRSKIVSRAWRLGYI